MSIYTSGTQARDGRTVNHDPEPWVCNHCGKRGVKAWNLDRAGRVHAPRPEYAVLDNPILAAFRTDWYRPEDDLGQEPDVLDYWIGWLDHTAPIRHLPDQINHARRVLTKLATLTEDYDPPYGDGQSFEPEGAIND